jgi:hypothetical protein
MAYQMTVRAIGSSDPEALNVFCSSGNPSIQGQSQALGAFYEEYADHCNGSVNFTLESEFREFDPATGQTTALHAFPGVQIWNEVGSSSSVTHPQQTCILVRWRTGTWVNGKQVTGRSYLPYPSASSGGNQVSSTAVNDIAGHAATMIAAASFHIYSPTNHAIYQITSASVWSDYAVQRRHRS